MSPWFREKLPTDGREETVGAASASRPSSRGDTLTCKDLREENFSLLRMMESFVYTQKVRVNKRAYSSQM